MSGYTVVDDSLREKSKYIDILEDLRAGKTLFIAGADHNKAPVSVLRYRLWLTGWRLRVRARKVESADGLVVWAEEKAA